MYDGSLRAVDEGKEIWRDVDLARGKGRRGREGKDNSRVLEKPTLPCKGPPYKISLYHYNHVVRCCKTLSCEIRLQTHHSSS